MKSPMLKITLASLKKIPKTYSKAFGRENSLSPKVGYALSFSDSLKTTGDTQ